MSELIGIQDTLLSYSESDLIAGGMIVGGIAGAGVAIALILYVLQVIAYWRIFTKAGEKGWKSIIPVYNMYVQYRLTWRTRYFWISLILAVVSAVFQTISESGDGNTFAMILETVCGIATLVFTIISYYRLARSFGHGGGFTVGLVLLNFIFMLILGFGKDAYIGNTCDGSEA